MNRHADSEEVAGRELRRLREARGWSQEQVARRMSAYGYNWHQTAVSRTESAERPLRLNEAIALAAVLDATLEGLLSAAPACTDAGLRDQPAARAARAESQLARIRAVLDEETADGQDA